MITSNQQSDTPGINIAAVSEWLEANIVGLYAPFQFEVITGGHSNLTFKVMDQNHKTLVLRRPPLGAVLATAHDMTREHKIISAIHPTSIPVPAPLALCEDESINDAPFYVMDYVEGIVLHDEETVVANLSTDHRQQLSQQVVAVLAQLHQLEPASVGLADLGRTDQYLDRQLKRWQQQWERSRTRELPLMDEITQILMERKPQQRYNGIVHGDYRFGNMLIDQTNSEIAAVLDWELCTLGDLLADLGYLLNSWLAPGEESLKGATAFPTQAGGFATREELLNQYCQLTGFDIDQELVSYYRAFQNWRLAAIIEGVLARYLKGVMADNSVDTDIYRQQVETLADQAARLLKLCNKKS